MKKLSIIIIVFLAVMVNQISAQEEAVFMHSGFNPVLINPAAVGADKDHHKVFMNIRRSWSGFVGTPRSYALSYNGRIGKNLGLGAMVFTENVADITRYRAQLSYAFRYNVKDFDLSIGLSTEFHRMRLTNDVIDSPLYQSGDESIERAMEGIKAFDASVGIHGMHKVGTSFGVSLPSLVRNKLDDLADLDGTGTSILSNYTFMLAHKFEMKESNFTVEPSVVVRKVRNVPLQIDFGVTAGFLKEKILTGLIYRTGTGGSLAILLGTKYNNLKFYYSYDLYFGEFQSYNGGSHEITFSFEFDRKDGKFDRSKKYRK